MLARLLAGISVLSVLLNPGQGGSAWAESAQPNVVVIVSDDAGWADYGFMRSATADANPFSRGAVPTPHLDALAGSGVVFTNGYTAAVCSPSRAALATGQYGGRIGYEQNAPTTLEPVDTVDIVHGLATESVTMWERMQSIGYATGAVGKWHIGGHADGDGVLGNRPQSQGVEEFRGLLAGSRQYTVGGQTGSGRLIETLSDGQGGVTSDRVIESELNGQYVTDVFGDQSVDYIRDKASDHKPFFLYTSFTAPHTPLQATAEDLAAIDALNDPAFSGNRRTYAAMQYAMDRNVGKILDALNDPDGDPGTDDGIAEDTLIVFINDNGGDCCDGTPNASHNGVLQRGKGTQYEGGVRVPIVVAGAGIAADRRGTVSDDLVHAVDVLPTIVVAGGGTLADNAVLPLEERIDGHDLVSRINGQAEARDALFLRRAAGDQTAVRVGDYKLFSVGGDNGQPDVRLYNLANDPGELTDLADQQPEVLDDLKRRLAHYEVQMDKARHDNAAADVNQFDTFRFREGAFSAAAWSQEDAWSGDGDTATMTRNDGYANAELIFRNRNGDYITTNDLTRVGGFEFMANTIRLTNRGAGETARDGRATIDGLPVLLVNDRSGGVARLVLGASVSGFDYTFDLALQLLLYDDLHVSGDGDERFVLTGGVSEWYRPGRSLFKTGQSTLELLAASDLTGAFVVTEGGLTVVHEDALGSADLEVRADGLAVLRELIALAVSEALGPPSVDFIDDDAMIELVTGGGSPLLQLDYAGIEIVGGLLIDGVRQTNGVYDAGSHPALFSGTGAIRVVPEPGVGVFALVVVAGFGARRGRGGS